MPIINVPKKIEKARDDLDFTVDERLVAACTTNPKGTVSRMTARQLGGLVGAVAADRVAGTAPMSDGHGLSERFVDGQNFLVITSRRMLLVKMSALTGRPKELVGEWRIEQVADITVEEGRLAYPMTILFVDGTAVQIEGAKGSDPKSVGRALRPA